MIGRFGLGKRSPSKETRPSDAPSSYNSQHVLEHTPPQSTSNFFSLPIWRRRTTPQSTSSTPPRVENSRYDDFGLPARRSSSNIPTRETILDSSSRADVPHQCNTHWLHVPGRHNGEPQAGPSKLTNMRNSSSSSRLTTYEESPDQIHPGFALARASLGVGLSHGMPGRFLPSPSSNVNSVPFTPDRAPESIPLPSKSILRKAKSFQKLTLDSPEDASNTLERRRTRGLSLGLRRSAEGKEKEKEQELPPMKPISRRPSFWRRRNDSSKGTPDSLRATPLPKVSFESDNGRPILPAILPMSPFHPDTSISKSIPPSLASQSSTNIPSSLHRRHSERTSPFTKEASSSEITLPSAPTTRRRKFSRPSTADPTITSSSVHSPLLDSNQMTSAIPVLVDKSENHPKSVSKARARAQTNPPLIHRLSMNLFMSSPATQPPLPLPMSATPHTLSPGPSPSNSPRNSSSKHSVEIPKPQIDQESPEDYVHRLMEAVNKADVASVLASSVDEFYVQSLRIYLSRFDLSRDSLDVALRKLLMHVGLPRETQQIDRVIEAFAFRYSQCNPGLFNPNDETYVLAFSLIMLHTDAFNKSNKHKMTKADYIKNIRLPGLYPEVLDCFYDNIVFAPFIFIEDPGDVPKERTLAIDGGIARRMSTFGPSGANSNGSTLLGKSARIDPYYLITRNELGPLRVYIDNAALEDPYSLELASRSLKSEAIHKQFINAASIEVCMDNHLVSPTLFGIPAPIVTASSVGMSSDLIGSSLWTVKVVKFGLLNRKEDVVEGGKRAINRKWKEWCVILTGSQLLLYRETALLLNTLARMNSAEKTMLQPSLILSRPDDILPLKDAIAVYDKSYQRRDNALRFAMQDGRQCLFQAADEKDMYDWIAHIDYASAFKAAGVLLRSRGMSKEEMELTGVAAAISHLREMEQRNRISPPQMNIRTWNANETADSDERRASHSDSFKSSATWKTSETTNSIQPTSLLSPGPSIHLKATFDQVKVDLAGGPQNSLLESPISPSRYDSLDFPSIHSPGSVIHETNLRRSSRTRAIKQKIIDLDSRISEVQSQIDSDLRFIRNVSVLTPFQRTTRDRLQLATNNVVRRIMQMRLEAAKASCYRDILSSDLVIADSKWREIKETALNAAREVLQNNGTLTESVVRAQLSPLDVSENIRMDHSADQELYTALDSPLHTSPGLAPSSSPVDSLPFHNREDGMELSTLESQDSQHESAHERYYTAIEMPEEQAEEWNKTKAAKRVSLVRVPPELRMSLASKPIRSGAGATVVSSVLQE